MVGGEDLEDEVPGEVDVWGGGLGAVVAAGVDEEAVVCVYVAVGGGGGVSFGGRFVASVVLAAVG